MIRFTLTDDNENQINGEAATIDAVADACWAYLRHHGAASVTARYSGGHIVGARLWTVTCELHDEGDTQ